MTHPKSCKSHGTSHPDRHPRQHSAERPCAFFSTPFAERVRLRAMSRFVILPLSADERRRPISGQKSPFLVRHEKPKSLCSTRFPSDGSEFDRRVAATDFLPPSPALIGWSPAKERCWRRRGFSSLMRLPPPATLLSRDLRSLLSLLPPQLPPQRSVRRSEHPRFPLSQRKSNPPTEVLQQPSPYSKHSTRCATPAVVTSFFVQAAT